MCPGGKMVALPSLDYPSSTIPKAGVQTQGHLWMMVWCHGGLQAPNTGSSPLPDRFPLIYRSARQAITTLRSSRQSSGIQIMAIRLATTADIKVVGHIAYRGFVHSPWWPWLRPHADEYPKDAETSYCREYEETLADRKKLFTVIEIPQSEKNETTNEKHPQVVGLAVWNLARDSPPIKDSLKIRALGKWTSIHLFATC